MSWNVPSVCTMAVFTIISIIHAALLFTVFGYSMHGESYSTLFNGHVKAAAWADFVLNLLTSLGIIGPLAIFLTPKRFKGVIPTSVLYFTSLLTKAVGLFCVSLTNFSLYTCVQAFFVSITLIQLFFGVLLIHSGKIDFEILYKPSSDSNNSQPAERDCPTPSTTVDSINTVYDANKEFPV